MSKFERNFLKNQNVSDRNKNSKRQESRILGGQNVDKKARGNKSNNRKRFAKEKEINHGRRDFLKFAFKTGVAISATGAVAKVVDKFLEEDELGEEIVKTYPIEKRKTNEGISKLKDREVIDETETQDEKIEKKFESERMMKEIVRVCKKFEREGRFDKLVFTDDLIKGQQFQESRGLPNAVNKEAKGIAQCMPVAMREVIRFLNNFREKGLSDYNDLAEISEEQAKELCNHLVGSIENGESVQKLNLLNVYDKDNTFNTGDNKDVFRGKSVKERQKLLLITYIDGPRKRLIPHRASKNARNYVKNIFGYMGDIKELRKIFKENGLPRGMNEAIMAVMRELDRPGNRKNQAVKDKTINESILKIKNALAQKKQTDKNGEESYVLTYEEITDLFPV